MEDEIETQLIHDCDCYTEVEEGGTYDKGCEDDDDEELVQPSPPPPPSSRGPP
jgi:hypothetical protein